MKMRIHHRRGMRRRRHRHCSARRGAWRRRESHAELRAGDTQHSGQVADRRGRRLSAGRGLASAHACKVGFHLRLCPVRPNRVAGERRPTRVYRAGESFYETPGSSHPVSRNASKTEPAKLLAVFVVDTDDKELTTPVK